MSKQSGKNFRLFENQVFEPDLISLRQTFPMNCSVRKSCVQKSALWNLYEIPDFVLLELITVET